MNKRPENWEDRPGNARPTPERMAKSGWRSDKKPGGYRMGETKDAGVKFAQDMASDPLQALYSTHHIAPWEWEAAEAFEVLARKIRGDVGQRSCINFEPVGHDETEGNAQLEGSWKVLRQQLGFVLFQAVDAAAYHRDEIDDLDRLKAGLEVCADYFGVSR